MALWKDPVKPASPSATPEGLNLARFDLPPEEHAAEPATAPAPTVVRPAVAAAAKSNAESLIAPDLAIEGKIEGAGHVRIAGRFKGDINVQGNLTIESGAKVAGSVRAGKVTIAGELIGNIEAASNVELLQSGALTGDVKAATLTVAAGSRMRGQAEFGWDDAKGVDAARGKERNSPGNGSVS